MKNAIFKEALREIRRSKNRFISILAIITVGCGFFAGVKSACPDMKLTARTYFDEHQLYDIQLISTFIPVCLPVVIWKCHLEILPGLFPD